MKTAPRERSFAFDMQREFRAEDFAGLYVAGAFNPVPRSLQEAGWPIRVGVTKSLEDTHTAVLDGNSPYWPQGVLFRVWARGWENVRALEDWVKAELLAGKEVRKSYYCMGPKFDPAAFEKRIHALAAQRNMPVWDDAALQAALLKCVHEKMARRARA